MKSSKKGKLDRLDPEAYRKLRREVLARDGWRCQQCGSTASLHVHHRLFRSHGGEDGMDNLITICAHCHDAIHRELGSQFKDGDWLVFGTQHRGGTASDLRRKDLSRARI